MSQQQQQGMGQGYSGPRQQGNYMQTPNVNMGYRQQQPGRGGAGGDGNSGNSNQQPSQAALQNPQLMAQLQRGQQQQHYQQQNRFQ